MRQQVRKIDVAIESPCTESWDNMSGTGRQRHCASCKKHVHNFAAMTPRQIERTIADHKGHLCARITRRKDGALVTAEELRSSGLAGKAASLVLGAALSTRVACAQSNPGTGKAIVSGRFTAPNGGAPPAQGYVVFAANGESILETKTDQDGKWNAEIAPGTYDIIFKTGPMFGERVNAVQLHIGNQQFATVRGRFDYGHLGLSDGPMETYVTVGEVIATYRYPVSYLFKHPFRYLKNLPHNSS